MIQAFEVQFCLGKVKEVIKDYSVKHELFSRVPFWNWTSVEYPETIWNLNSYSHNAELNNFYVVKIINFVINFIFILFKIKILF